MPNYLVQEEDGTSHLVLEDDSGDLLLETFPPSRVTQVSAEVVYTPDSKGRTSQTPAEVVYTPISFGRVSQEAAEVVFAPSGSLARVSQASAEVVFRGDAAGRISQSPAEFVVQNTTLYITLHWQAWFIGEP